MMIITTINEYDFKDAFRNMNRQDSFSAYGLSKLFEYFEMVSNESGEDIELDVIAICCEYVEYNSLEELQADYKDIDGQDDLEYNTQVICYQEDCIIIQSY